MRYRTNFDVINKKDKTLFLSVKSYDCFGHYTNHPGNLEKSKNHIVKYYLPRTYLTTNINGLQLEKYDNPNSKIDRLIFTDEEIQFYLDILNSSWPNMNVKRIEDLVYNIQEFDKSYPYDNRLSNIKYEPAVTLEIDLSNTINAKDVKIHLFLCRYLINFFGNKVLKNTLNLIKKDNNIDFWDAFIMNEFIESFIIHNKSYSIFSNRGLFKYFTLIDFYNKVIVDDPDEFIYEKTYIKTGLIPCYLNDDYPYDKYYIILNKQNSHIINFKKIYEELGAGKEFLEYWKNYNW